MIDFNISNWLIHNNVPYNPQKENDMIMKQSETVIFPSETERFSIDSVCTSVFEVYNLTPEEAMRKTRKREVVVARQVAQFYCKRYTKESYCQIGRYFGKDHATIMHSEKTIRQLIETDKAFNVEMIKLNNKILSDHFLSEYALEIPLLLPKKVTQTVRKLPVAPFSDRDILLNGIRHELRIPQDSKFLRYANL